MNEQTRSEAGWGIIVLFLIAISAAAILATPAIVEPQGVWLDILVSTRAWIQPQLILGLVTLVITLVIVRGLGRVPLSKHLGYKYFFKALLWMFIVWVITQLALITIGLLASADVSIRNEWGTPDGANILIGAFIATFLGGALVEGIGFRDFLYRQIFWKIERRLHLNRDGQGLTAIFISQLIYAIVHLLSSLSSGRPASDIPAILFNVSMAGVAYSVIYLGTQNLWFSIGMNALYVNPIAVFESNVAAATVVGLSMAAIVARHMLFSPRRLHVAYVEPMQMMNRNDRSGSTPEE